MNHDIPTTMQTYPVDAAIPRLIQALKTNASAVLHAPPGAGKTTRVPTALLDLLPEQGRIVMLEPRRIAAVSSARWMAETLRERVGETVGYTIRFDSKKSDKTRIEIVTEGVLNRRIQSDPGLEGVSLVIFDEFHERSIHADLALALCLDIRSQLRPDLKILVMSATLDCEPIASLLSDAPVITSSGKAFPVEERYLPDPNGPLHHRIAAAVRTALRETEGDILVFLPGSGEIRAAASLLRESLPLQDERISLHPLFGDLPFDEQERAIMPSRDYRKIVLATNIAETSLTIEGVRVVIDCGLTRTLRYEHSTGMNRLVTIPVSRASAEQRKGRAGRLGPGLCYRLYGQHDVQGMVPFPRPEILASDLAPLVLELAAWGVKDPNRLSWLDAPPKDAWDSGLQLLTELGALDRSGSITSAGRSMARLPLHPRLARLMARAGELDCSSLGADLAALLSERDIIRRPSSERGSHDTDILERINLFHRWRQGGDVEADKQVLKIVDRTARRILQMVGEGSNDVRDADHRIMTQLLISAYPDRICKRREGSDNRFVLAAQGRGVRLPPESQIGSSPYLIAVNVDAGAKAEGTVHLAAPLDEAIIRSELTDRIETVRHVAWDERDGRIVAAREERIGSLVLAQKSIVPDDEEAGPILCEAIRSNPALLSFRDADRQYQARVSLLSRAFPEEPWPDLSDDHLFSAPEQWLLPWLGGIRSAQALRGIDILAALKAMLSWEQQRLLEERTPTVLTVPSGSRIRLDYSPEGPPILAVKLQELFGLADTPVIAEGRVTVLLHLLSPARRPVQVTQDLKGFWNTGYLMVKKDLKGRYPKHPWPDDPWNAMPTRHTKQRGGQ